MEKSVKTQATKNCNCPVTVRRIAGRIRANRSVPKCQCILHQTPGVWIWGVIVAEHPISPLGNEIPSPLPSEVSHVALLCFSGFCFDLKFLKRINDCFFACHSFHSTGCLKRTNHLDDLHVYHTLLMNTSL